MFVGTGKGVTGNKAFPIKGRFKGRRVAMLRRLFGGGALLVATEGLF